MSTVYSVTFVLAELVVYAIEEEEGEEEGKKNPNPNPNWRPCTFLSVSTRNPHCMILGVVSHTLHGCV